MNVYMRTAVMACKKLLCAMLLLLILPSVSWSQDLHDKYRYNRDDNFDFDESLVEQWKEEKIAIPPPPGDDADMVKLVLHKLGNDFEVMVDKNSLKVGEKDRVARYWLVVKGRLGAVNKMYEGIRCATKEYKTYAYASKRKKDGISRLKRAKWLPLKGVRGNDYHKEMALDFFCHYSGIRSEEEIVKLMNDSSTRLFMKDNTGYGQSSFY